MKTLTSATLALALAGSGAAFAQDSVVGTYTGTLRLTGPGGSPVDMGVTLVIAKVEDGKLSGTGRFSLGPCSGDYPVQGVVKGDGIGLRSGKGGAAGDCLFGFKGRIEGNQLVGSMGPHEIVLRK